ncbi:MAG: DUF2127 domain-containing protein [Actinobacteria bacterium]|nr:DUF2127 domain-containing protein [Actinomycetota bacterium]
MATGNAPDAPVIPPGAERPRRYRPRLRYELIGCGLHGHELLGTEAARLRPEDSLFAREFGGLRWYRCLRCDSWLALTPPSQPTAKYPPDRRDVTVPLRGRPLRDKYVLRVIAVERAIHFLVLSALAAAIFLFASNKVALNADFTKILNDLQGGLGGPVNPSHHGIVHDLQRLFAVHTSNLYLIGVGVAVYAALEGTETVGLWLGKRWAEYLTFIATVIFIPYEVEELAKGVSALKLITFLLNLAIAVYLVWAKRLFGVHGGRRAEEAEREQDSGWSAIERSAPVPAAGSAEAAGSAGAAGPAGAAGTSGSAAGPTSRPVTRSSAGQDP